MPYDAVMLPVLPVRLPLRLLLRLPLRLPLRFASLPMLPFLCFSSYASLPMLSPRGAAALNHWPAADSEAETLDLRERLFYCRRAQKSTKIKKVPMSFLTLP